MRQGIFLAPLSEQSSRMFGFVFKMFAQGGISLPKGGIGALSDQLASKLKPGTSP
jgi:phytoene dehydrogenase-like protein